MKKLKGLIGILVLLVVLTACSGGAEEKRTFVLDKDGINTTLIYTHKGDKVTRQSTESIINYELSGLGSKEAAKELFNPLIAQLQGYEGLSHSMDYGETEAVENIEIDYEVIDFKKVSNLPGMQFDEASEAEGISMEKSADFIESQGFTEVK